MGFDLEAREQWKFAVVLVHEFGGGVFSWRHVTNLLVRQVGCTVLAFDRTRLGLTSRPCRKDWEKKNVSNSYELESQVSGSVATHGHPTRIIGGLKKNKVISKLERRTIAHHDSGHAVARWFLEHPEPLLNVTIVPRGTAALGFAYPTHQENVIASMETIMMFVIEESEPVHPDLAS